MCFPEPEPRGTRRRISYIVSGRDLAGGTVPNQYRPGLGAARPKLAFLVRRSSTRISSGGPLKAGGRLASSSEPAAGVHLTCFLAEATVLRPDLFER